jgi:hypothetical protein
MNDNNDQENKSSIVLFFSRYNVVITGVASLLGILGIFLTCQQIKETKIQIRANTSYQIHKDGREIFKSIPPDIIDIITNRYPNKEYAEDSIKIAESKINEILMYYASLFKQNEFGNIDKSSWEKISNEICNFMNFKMVKEYWVNRVSGSRLWNQKFIDYGNSCSKGEK